MVEVRNLSLSIGGRKVLDDIGFCLEDGVITVLLGVNGSGKTSLLRCLSSYYRNYCGTILFDGKELGSMGAAERRKAHAIMPQMIPSVDIVLEELLLSALLESPFSRPGEKEKKIIDRTIDLLGLGRLRGRPVSRMSGGERQLSFLAFLLVHDSGLYILDEPESHLDAVFSRKVDKVIESLRGSGHCVIAVLHDIERALRLADRILVLDEGKLVFNGTADGFLGEDIHGRYFSLQAVRLMDEEGRKVISFR